MFREDHDHQANPNENCLALIWHRTTIRVLEATYFSTFINPANWRQPNAQRLFNRHNDSPGRPFVQKSAHWGRQSCPRNRWLLHSEEVIDRLRWNFTHVTSSGNVHLEKFAKDEVAKVHNANHRKRRSRKGDIWSTLLEGKRRHCAIPAYDYPRPWRELRQYEEKEDDDHLLNKGAEYKI